MLSAQAARASAPELIKNKRCVRSDSLDMHTDRKALRQLFLRHRGSMSRLARELAIDPATLSNWFHRGDTSARIAAAVNTTAEQLTGIDQEHAAMAQKLKALDEQIKELKKRQVGPADPAAQRRREWSLIMRRDASSLNDSTG
jgi:hypothetical protein